MPARTQLIMPVRGDKDRVLVAKYVSIGTVRKIERLEVSWNAKTDVTKTAFE